jgi:mannose/fructose/N-acetylgalactosamine-specific phosphotransferase system component IIC
VLAETVAVPIVGVRAEAVHWELQQPLALLGKVTAEQPVQAADFRVHMAVEAAAQAELAMLKMAELAVISVHGRRRLVQVMLDTMPGAVLVDNLVMAD